MTTDAKQIITSVFSNVYSLFTSFEIPGTSITPLALMLGIFGTMLAISVINRIFDSGIGIIVKNGEKNTGSKSNPTRYKGKERKNDTK